MRQVTYFIPLTDTPYMILKKLLKWFVYFYIHCIPFASPNSISKHTVDIEKEITI